MDLHDLAHVVRCCGANPTPAPLSVDGDPCPDHVDQKTWRAAARWLLRHRVALTEWEAGFVASLARYRILSPKQEACLNRILMAVREAGPC